MDSVCLDTHLNSPLSITLILEALVTQGSPRTPLVRVIQEELLAIQEYLGDKLPTNYNSQVLLPELMTLTTQANIGLPHCGDLSVYLKMLTSFVPHHLQKLQLTKTLDDYADLIVGLENHVFYPQLKGLYNLRCFLEQGVCLSAKPLKFSRESSLESWKYWRSLGEGNRLWEGLIEVDDLYLHTIVGRNTCYINYQGYKLVSSRNHFLMLSDVISQRLLCYISCIWAEMMGKTNYPSYSTLTSVFQFGDQIIRNFKNKGYKSLALWESLIIGHLLKRSQDEAVDSTTFYDTMIKELLESQTVADHAFLNDHFNRIELTLVNQNPDQLMQLFGLYRIWGHPTINECEGMKKLKEISCKPRTVNQDYINLMTWKWREYFCLNFYAKHNRWPVMEFIRSSMDSALLTAIQNAAPITTLTPGYKLEDWKYIKFQKNFSVPEKFELSEMIADKATSHGLKDLIAACERDNTIGSSHSRSVILKWLNTNYNNPEIFLQQINDIGFSEDERCVGLHPKERELKIYARMFGLLTIEKRLYVVLTEAMLAENVFPYFPEITMTFDSVTLQHRIYSNTKYHQKQKGAHAGKYHVITNLDFMKWNQYMRESETAQLFSDFDHLFGFTNVYRRTHEMFNTSYMYLADGTFTPFKNSEPQLGDNMWIGHLGGVEGLRQKGWTIFTVVLLKYITEVYSVACQIMGQGDNQVVIFEYALDSVAAVRELHQTVIAGLRTALTHIGPPLKLEETWSSSMFFIYGKFPVWKGKPLSLSLKKLCRTMRLTNEGFQNLESTLSSITANASAATASDHDPIIPYLIGTLETVGAINLHWNHPFYQDCESKIHRGTRVSIPANGIRQLISPNFSEYTLRMIRDSQELMIVCVANYPNILGGFPALQLCDLMNHGFPDPLSLNLWSLKDLYLQLPESAQILKKAILNMINPISNPEQNAEMLCQDPVSLNILHSSSGSEKIKRMVFEFMTTSLNVTNQHFLTFLQLAKQRQTDLSQTLITMKPMNPRVAHSILSATIVGRAMKVVSKINKTKTIIGLMLKANNPSTILREFIDNSENEYFDRSDLIKRRKPIADLFGSFERNFFLSVLMGLFSYRELRIDHVNFCSTVWAQQLREQTWNLPISGVTVMVPAECFIWSPSNGLNCTDQNHAYPELGQIQVLTDLDASHLHQTGFSIQSIDIGPFKPFFGSTTVNKIKYEGKSLKNIAPPILKGAIELLGLIGWGTNANSDLTKLIMSIFSSFTDLDPLRYVPDPGSISGSVEHRWQDKTTSHSSSLSILYLACTHFTVLTNHFKPYNLPQGSLASNFNISFQTIFTWISCIWSSRLVYQPQLLNKCYHLHVNCTSCVQPINETKLDIEPNGELMKALTSQIDPSNVYCWIPKEKLLGPELQFSQLPASNPENQSERTLKHLLELYVVDLYLNEFSLQVASSQVKISLPEKTKYIPVNIIGDLSYHGFFYRLTLFMVLQYYLLRVTSLTQSTVGLIPLGDIISQISRLPLNWYAGMQSLLINHSAILNLLKHNPGISLPLGSPPSPGEKNHFFKKIILNYLRRITTNLSIVHSLQGISKLPSIQSPNIIFNPQLLTVLSYCFSAERESSRQYIMFLSEVRTYQQSLIERQAFNSSLDLSSLPLSTEVHSSKHNTEKIQRKLKEQLYPPIIKSSLDAVGKLLTPYKKEISDSTGEHSTDPFTAPLIDLGSLPLSATVVVDQLSGTYSQQANLNIPKSISYPSVVSFRNHYFKAETPITTAAYKPLSVLQCLSLKESLPIENSESVTLGAFGDGSGGYTLLLGRLYNKCQLVMNTLFDASLLSSTGIDNYIPAAPGMIPSVWSRLIQKNIVTEGVSDITEDTFPLIYQELNMTLRLIISDAEGAGWEHPLKALKMLGKLLAIAQSSSTEVFIFKTYASSLDALYAQFIILAQKYERVLIIRSWFSSHGNTEVFLCGLRLKTMMSRIGFFVDVKNSTTRISLHGNFLVPLTFQEFGQFFNQSIYMANPDQIAAQYDAALSIPEWQRGCLNIIYQRVYPHIDEGKLIFPSSLIKKYRKELHLVKFTHDVLSRYRFNFLTHPVMRDICYHYYFLLGTCIKDVEEVERLLTSIRSGWFVFFETVDRSWAFSWRATPPNWMNAKSERVGDLLNSTKIKELIIEWRRIRDLHLSIEVPMLDLRAPFLPHCKEVTDWMGRPHLPLHMTPILHYSRDAVTGTKIPQPIILKLYKTPWEKAELSNIELLEETGMLHLYTSEGQLVKLNDKTIQISKEQTIISRLLKPIRLS